VQSRAQRAFSKGPRAALGRRREMSNYLNSQLKHQYHKLNFSSRVSKCPSAAQALTEVLAANTAFSKLSPLPDF